MTMNFSENQPAMLSVEEARELVLELFHPLEPESKPLLGVLGQVLAEDVTSPMDIPPLHNSAMDGYAVQHQSIVGASHSSPRNLRVVGQVAAGELPQQEVSPGTAVRIMTGAPVPAGADTVVPFEDTDEYDGRDRGRDASEVSDIAVRADIPEGANIRPAGQDIRQGQIVLRKGTLVRPAEIGILASVGRDTVQVIRRPVVAVIATGDELMAPGEPILEGKIYNSNGYSVSASVLRYGGVPRFLGIAGDNLESLGAKIQGSQMRRRWQREPTTTVRPIRGARQWPRRGSGFSP